MEVILNKDVNRLGRAGQVVKVKDGFARNFLIPNGLAVIKTQSNLKKLEQEKEKRSLEVEKARKQAEELKSRLADLSLTIPVLVQEEDKLYGSITGVELENSLREEGFDIGKNSILLEQPIKSLGIYEVAVRLHPEVLAKIKVWIVKK